MLLTQYPAGGGFGIPRFSKITLQLADSTGTDPASVQLTVGDLGTFTLTNKQLTLTNGVLTFDAGGDKALGDYGQNVQASIVVADTLGNSVTNNWAFDLEAQPLVTTNLFVFGSPKAQRVGQRIGNIPTAFLANRFGPVPMGDGDPWTLELVESNRLELSYTTTAPGFAANTYVCNLTPARPGEIFNRKIISVNDDPVSKRLTLFTIEVPLTEVVTNGAAALSASSVILQTGTNGAFVKAFSIDGTVAFPRIGYSLDGTELKLKDSVGDFDIVKLTLEEQHWWLTPRLQAALEVNWGELKRFEAIASGNVDAAAVWKVDVLLAGVALEKTLLDVPGPETWVLLGTIGPVPIYASLGLDVKVKARAEAHATLSFRAGMHQSMDAAFGLTYNKPDLQWVHTFEFPQPDIEPFTANINAEGSLKLSLEPALEFLVYGLAGISAGITPSGSIVFETGTGQALSGRLDADVTLDLKPAGPALEWLSPKPELSLSLWHDEWHLFPGNPAVSFTKQPESHTVPAGGAAYFSCAVSGPDTPSYQWFFSGVPMPGQTSRTLLIPSVNSGHAGKYQVRVTAGTQTANSDLATLIVLPKSLESGLVAYYPFDGNANDASGNGRNGTSSNVSPTSDRFQKPNGALAFDGLSSEVIVDPINIAGGSFSLAAWVKKSKAITQSQLIFGQGNTIQIGNYHLQVGWRSDSVFTFSFYGNDLDTPPQYLDVGTWHHWTSTYDAGSGDRRIYRDGLLVASDTTANYLGTGPLHIGKGWEVVAG